MHEDEDFEDKELKDRIASLETLILVLDDAVGAVRVVGGNQNVLGWRDLLGAEASRIRKVRVQS